MFSDTSTDQLVLVFNYSQFNVWSSATIFTTRTLLKSRQIFIAFADSLSGQMIKSLITLISVVCKYFKLSLLTSYFFCIFSTDLYFLESVLTSCYSCAPRGKIIYVLRSSWFSSVVEEFENWWGPAVLGGNVAINIYVTIVRQTINETL